MGEELYSFFFCSGRNLSSACVTPALCSWPGNAGQQQLPWDGHRPQLNLQSSARFHGVSLPQGQNLFLSWSYKRLSLFPFTLYHIKHIPTHRTTPTLFGRKINGEASLDFQRKLIVATLVSVGNSGSSKDSPCVFSQPGSEVMLQGIIILCIRFTPCGCSLKSSYFPLRLKWGFGIMICTILSHSMFKTILHCSGEQVKCFSSGSSQLFEILKLGQSPLRYSGGEWFFWDWGQVQQTWLRVKNPLLRQCGGEDRAWLSIVLSVQKSWDYMYFESNPICKLAARGKWRQLAIANLESI